MSKRKFSSRSRRTKVRDARLIIIAAEGRKTENQYFRDLAKRYRNSGVHVEILEAEDTKSAPKHIIKRLNYFKGRFSLDKNDELWLVIDVDRWQEKMLSNIARQCIQKKYHLAVSNPCFELWLLLHIATWDDYSEEQVQIFFDNAKEGYRTALEKELMQIVDEHNKSKLKSEYYIPHVEKAIEQAKALDKNPDSRWTQSIGTRVYLLAESIINKK